MMQLALYTYIWFSQYQKYISLLNFTLPNNNPLTTLFEHIAYVQ